jgi:hypothetical protein
MGTTILALGLAGLALTGAAELAAQAVERTDVPGRGVVRVTFDPRIMTWDAQFVDGARLRLGAPLTGDTVGSAASPTLARLEQDIRTASRVPGVVLSLGAGLFSVRQERRTTPIMAEVGLTERLAVSVMVPIVRVATRTRLQLASRGANLGLNPLFSVVGAAAAYGDFFAQFDTTLDRFDFNIAAGMYGCPPSPPGGPCAARDSSVVWRAVHDALVRSVYGVGQTGSPFLPQDTSDAGRAIDTTVARIQRALATTYAVVGFADSFLLAVDTLSGDLVEAMILDNVYGFGYNARPFRNSFRYGLGDIEVAAKYRLATGAHYAAAVVALARLPTAYRDSADDLLRQSLGDHQTDLEGRLVQELIVGGRLWLNLAVRAGTQRPGTRVRRVGPSHALLVPAAATAALAWDPGDYLGVDVAPLMRLGRQFAVGVTASYWTKQRDRYSFRSAQDSSELATRLGVPTAASMLDHGTAERRLGFGVAVTYVAPHVEGGLSVEQTVSGAGVTPAATVYRIVLRTSRRFF